MSTVDSGLDVTAILNELNLGEEHRGYLGVKAVAELAFGRPRSLPLRDRDLNELPRDTTLHRAMIDHLLAGGEWRWRHGTFRLT